MLGARDPAASGAVHVGLAVHKESLVVEDVGDVLVAGHCAVLINVDFGHEVLELLVGGNASTRRTLISDGSSTRFHSCPAPQSPGADSSQQRECEAVWRAA